VSPLAVAARGRSQWRGRTGDGDDEVGGVRNRPPLALARAMGAACATEIDSLRLLPRN